MTEWAKSDGTETIYGCFLYILGKSILPLHRKKSKNYIIFKCLFKCFYLRYFENFLKGIIMKKIVCNVIKKAVKCYCNNMASLYEPCVEMGVNPIL